MSTLIAVLAGATLFAVFAVARIRHTDCGGSCGSCTHACSRGEEDHAHR